MGSTDRPILHDLARRTGGRTVFVFPSSVCKACGKEYVNRTELRTHNCQEKLRLAAWPSLAAEERLAARWCGGWSSSASPW